MRISLATAEDEAWWSSLTPLEKKAFVRRHPRSKYARLMFKEKRNAYSKFKHKALDIRKAKAEFFRRGEDKLNSGMRAKFGKFFKEKANRIVKRIKKDVREWKGAAEAANKLAAGEKLNDKEVKALKSVVLDSLFAAASIAISNGLGLSIAYALPALAGKLLKKSVTNGIKESFVSKSETENDSNLIRLILSIGDSIVAAPITQKEWEAAFDKAEIGYAK